MQTCKSFGKRTLGVAAAIGVFCLIGALGIAKLTDNPKNERPDMLVLDDLKQFGDLEKPVVYFFHDLHTDAMDKRGKDCAACHLKTETDEEPFNKALRGIDRYSPKFMRYEDTSRRAVMEVYHTNCIDCHQEIAEAGEATGPVVCGECHKEKTLTSSRLPMEMDRSLHYRHSKRFEQKCETCHHKYNEEEEKLYYEKEKEASCRYCHETKTEENRLSMARASHLSCIGCHRKIKTKQEKTGPEKCYGCHGADARTKIARIEDVPRMKRNQPDTVLISVLTGNEDEDPDAKAPENRMHPVPFNHMVHEKGNDTCRVCHHESLEKCGHCHTLTGNDKGDGVKLARAMHFPDSEHSCIGCHSRQQASKDCAGCHDFMPIPETAALPTDSSCKTCHMENVPENADPEEAAKSLLESRTITTGTIPAEQIPDKIVIKDMVDKYEAVKFPHRKVVTAIAHAVGENKLAGYFHPQKETLCRGCHHHSPPDKKPPRCGYCHNAPFDERQPHMPGMMGAYHQQCIGCHERMEVKKPVGCTECHKERKTG